MNTAFTAHSEYSTGEAATWKSSGKDFMPANDSGWIKLPSSIVTGLEPFFTLKPVLSKHHTAVVAAGGDIWY